MSVVFPPGTILNNRYQIQRVLSSKGGMGLLYLARDLHTQNLVAVKRNKDNSPDARDQFRREADLLRPLRHPNLVRVEDYFEDLTGAQFLVMEYVPGDDLAELMKRRQQPFPLSQVIEWSKVLCNVLGYLHKQNPPIIHRDLKPDNIKLKPDGVLVLVDFGIAKIFTPGQKTHRGARAVTAGYAPIEQYGSGTDQRTDLYALGAVMHFLLTMQPPDEAPLRLQNPQLHLPNLPPAVVAVITKALAVKPPDRFQSADEMLAALVQIQPSVSPPSGIGVSTRVCAVCGTPNRASAIFCASCGKQLSVSAPRPSVVVKCPQCGASNRAIAKVCLQCGKALVPSQPVPALSITCANCGAQNRSTARFCIRCRQPLAPAYPAPVTPPRPIVPPPFAPGLCPSCGYTNSPNDVFCQQCGYALQPIPAPGLPIPSSSPKPVAPSPAPQPPAPQPTPPVGPLPEQKTVGWILFATGIAAMLFGIWQTWSNGTLAVTLPLIALGIFTAIAGRDLLNLFDSFRSDAPFWLAPAFGDVHRGRRWGAIAATLWIIIGAVTAWLIVPLVIASAMMFALHVLVSERFAQSIGVSSTRPGWVIVIGWLLTFSGIGTIPGIALLIPTAWAKSAVNLALVVLGFVSAFGVMISVVGLGVPPTALPVDWKVPGTNTSALALSALTANLALFASVIAALRYLAIAPVTPGTQTARRRELNVAAWTLLGVGIVMLGATWAWANASPWAGLSWLGVAISALAIVGARDLLDLGGGILSQMPLVVGSMARGRRLGIVAMSLLALVSVLLIWMVAPALFLIIAIFLLYELMRPETLLECGETPNAPPGVTLIGWALLPTGLGTLPGILMLRGEATGWRWARFALGALVVTGLGLVLWALAGVGKDLFTMATLASAGLSLNIGSLFALAYMNRPNVKQYFHV